MTNFTPEMTEEEAKAAPESGELSDNELDDVSGGTVVRYSFNLQLDNSATTNFTRADALIAREMYCENCKQNTIFHFPTNGAAYCSVCKQLLAAVEEAPYIPE